MRRERAKEKSKINSWGNVNMPREYAPCREGNRRYEVTTESMGRAVSMCRELDEDDTMAKPGRRTRCFNPDKPSRRKTCLTLVPNEFKTIVPISLYFPVELQRRSIRYTCANDNDIMLAAFEARLPRRIVETIKREILA